MRKIELKNKTALIFSSGSLISIKANKSIFFVDQESDIPQWLSELPEVKLLANITPIFLQGESEGFSPKSLKRILTTLIAEREKYDGFVVLVRAESLVLTSAACEFMLQGFGKPIIFTGSRYSPEALAQQNMESIIKAGGLGLRSNLINALQVATNPNFSATGIMFGSKLIKPTKAVIADFRSINLFRSFDETYLGKVDFGITLNRVPQLLNPMKLNSQLSENVRVMGPNPLGIAQTIEHVDTNKTYTTLLMHIQPNEQITSEALDHLKKKYRRIVLFNQHYVLEHHGVASITHMSWAAAVAKVLWADAAAKSNHEFMKLIQEDIVGEYKGI